MQERAAKLRRDAMTIFRAGLEAAEAGSAVRRYFAVQRGWLRAGGARLSMGQFDRVFLIGAGKAAVEMAGAVESILGPRLTRGVIVTKHGHAIRQLRSQILEAGHPVPDRGGVAAAAAIRDLLSDLNASDLLIVVISGGASALLPAPAEPITLEAKQETTELLLRAGATITQLNAVRKHLSSLKGGRLAALAHPATVLTMLLSDVIGDALDVIGSGPTAPDTSTFGDAVEVLRGLGLLFRVPRSVREYLEAGARGEVAETPKPGDPVFESVHNVIVGSNRLALEAAAEQANKLGYEASIASTAVQGEASDVARAQAEILKEIVASGKAACILLGGETTVKVRGHGKGGRNQEFALAAAVAIAGMQNVLVLSAGTDGTDGATDAAGAIASGDTVERGRRLGVKAADYLLNNDSYAFFDALGDLIRTGPTGTNVMDIHLLLADGS